MIFGMDYLTSNQFILNKCINNVYFGFVKVKL